MKKTRLCDLLDDTLNAYQTLGVKVKVCENYRSSGCGPIQSYFTEHKQKYYSEALLDEFVDSIQKQYSQDKISRYKHTCIRKVAALLKEYQRTGTLIWSVLPPSSFVDLSVDYFKTILYQYSAEIVKSGRISRSTSICFRTTVRHFLRYLEKCGHKNFKRLSLKTVSNYISASTIDCSSNPISVLKSFLLFLYDQNIAEDLTAAIQFVSVKKRKFHKGFTREESNKLISSVNTDSTVGKRDRAILLLGANTGLRGIDVAHLKLDDIDWHKDEIRVIQHKTGRPLNLPLDNLVGNAIADYILNGRPGTASPFLFLSMARPLRPLGPHSISSLVSRYITKSGIENSPLLRKGFHSFRRGMGTWLLEAEMPLAMIREILGHSHIDSTKPYLSTDLKGLRSCAIGLVGIEVNNEVLR